MTKEMNLIFDLQLFAGISKSGTTIKGTTGADGTKSAPVKISKNGNKIKAELNGSTLEDNFEAVSLGNNADVVSIAGDVSGLTFNMGKGNDYVTIEGGNNYRGNTFQYASGDGNDTILGWTASDTLKITSGLVKSVEKSADGDDLILKIGSYSVTFKGVGASDSKVTSINLGTADKIDIPGIRQGTSKADTIVNIYGKDGYHHGANSDTAYTIEGGGGADKITNDANYMYISGGALGDTITIKSTTKTHDVTQGVTIYGGIGNDVIDVTKDSTTSTVGAHVYEYRAGEDGKDTIRGYNDGDSILIYNLEEAGITSDTIRGKSYNAAGGKYVIQIGDDSIVLDNVKGGTRLNIYSASYVEHENEVSETVTVTAINGGPILKASDNGSWLIPKEFVGTSAADNLRVTDDYAGYTVKAYAGADTINVSTSDVYVLGGDGADSILLTGGTNINKSNSEVNTHIVTIQGGNDNDYIDASGDTVTKRGDTVLATHIYEFDTDDGKDTIVGFNSGDTIRFNVSLETAMSSITGEMKSGYYRINVGKDGKNYIDIKFNDNFKPGDKLYLEAQSNTTGTGYSRLGIDGADVKGNVVASDTNNIYLPKFLLGTSAADGDTVLANTISAYSEATKQNAAIAEIDGFTIKGYNGDDVIYNAGSNVYIDAGDGNDQIKLMKAASDTTKSKAAGNNAADIYAKNVTVYGGLGNDLIIRENDGSSNPEADDNANNAYVYKFGAGDGNDTIQFMNANDTISIASGSTIVGSSIKAGENPEDPKDLIFNVAYTNAPSRVTATITFTGYATDPDNKVNVVYEDPSVDDVTMDVPREIRYTTTEDTATYGKKNDESGSSESYKVYALQGNDTITNYANFVTLDGGEGNDLLIEGGDSGYIVGGVGGDKVVLLAESNTGIHYFAGAQNTTVEAGTGNDTIIANNGGHTYVFNKGDGTNYIYGFSDADTIKFGKGITSRDIITPEITEDGYQLSAGTGTDRVTVILKGQYNGSESARFSDTAIIAGLTASDFERIPGNYFVNAGFSDTDEITTYKVAKNIIGTNDDDSATAAIYNLANINGDSDRYTIEAKSGNDFIITDGDKVSIDGGDGNDTIAIASLVSDVAVAKLKQFDEDAEKGSIYPDTTQNTIIGGKGDDLIISNGSGHVYVYKDGDGNDTILGFSAADTLSIDGEYEFASVTANGFEVRVGSSSILLKGEFTDTNVGSVVLSDTSIAMGQFNALEGGTFINIIDNVHTDKKVEVQKMVILSEESETYVNTLEGYEIRALNGNDKITNKANEAIIDAGDGDDEITLDKKAGDDSLQGRDVTVRAGQGNDVITNHNTDAPVVYEFSLGDDENFIHGITENDTISIKDGSIQSAEFGTGSQTASNTYILTLSDGITKVSLEGIADNNGITKLGTGGTKSYQLMLAGETTATRYVVPDYIIVTDDKEIVRTDHQDAYIVGRDNTADEIINSSTNVSIAGYGGNDTITAAGLNNTVYSGKGNDYIILKQDGQVVQYKQGDGDDTIEGWADNDTLQISGATYTTDASKGGNFVIKVGVSTITFKDINVGSKIKIVGTNNGEEYSSELTVPRLLYGAKTDNKGTGAIKNLASSGKSVDNFVIQTYGGKDEIINDGDYSTIYAGINDDTVTNSGTNVVILGDGGADKIYNYGHYASIDAGTGDDIVALSKTVEKSTILAGAGDDTLIGSNAGNTFVFDANNMGKNVILGYNEANTIHMLNTTSETLKNSASVTANGVVFKFSDGNTLTLKGTMSSTSVTDITDSRMANPNYYDFVVGGTKVNFVFGENADTSDTYTIEAKKVVASSKSLNNLVNYYTIEGAAGKETISNSGASVVIEGLDGNDRIENSGASSTLKGGKGNDLIINKGNNVLIKGEEDDDIIVIDPSNIALDDASDTKLAGLEAFETKPSNVTIVGGTGNDKIYGNDKGSHVYEYNKGDGKDTIFGFNSFKDTILLNGIELTEINNDNITIENTEEKDNGIKVADVTFKLDGGSITLAQIAVDSAVKFSGKKGNVKSTTTFTVPKLQVITDSESYINDKLYEGYLVRVDYKGDSNKITNKAAYVTLQATAGGDKEINNVDSASYVVITTGDGNDVITNNSKDALEVTINAGDGLNNITNIGAGAVITTGIDSDTVTNYGQYSTIITGEGDDFISIGSDTTTYHGTTIIGDQSVIDAGAGNDSINIDANVLGVSVKAGEDDDLIQVNGGSGHVFTFNSSSGNDIIDNIGEGNTFEFELAADEELTTVANEDGLSFKIVDTSKDENDKDYVKSSVLVANYNSSTKETTPIQGGIVIGVYDVNGKSLLDGSVTTPYVKYAYGSALSNDYENNYLLQGDEKSNNIINNGGSNITIDAGAESDTITIGNFTVDEDGALKNNSVSGGEGNDTITVANTAVLQGLTINGGTGDDVIYAVSETNLTRTNGIVFEYNVGDGNDVIQGFIANDTIKIGGEYSVTIDSIEDKNPIIKIGEGSIKLQGYSDTTNQLTINVLRTDIEDAEVESVTIPKFVNLTTSNTYTTAADSDNMVINAATAGVAYTVVNKGDNVGIYGNNKADKVTNEGAEVLISTKEEADVIDNSGKNATILAGEGNDKVTNSGASAVISLGAGNDAITLKSGSSGAVVNVGAGTDVIINEDANNGHVYQIASTDGNNTIKGFTSNDTIQVMTDNAALGTYGINSFQNGYFVVTIGSARVSLEGEDLVGGTAINLIDAEGNKYDGTIAVPNLITLGTGNIGENYSNTSTTNPGNIDNYFIQGTANNNEIVNSGTNVSISALGGNDNIINYGNNATLLGGEGTDAIYNSGDNVKIYGGAGNDEITNKGSYVTIQGGAGTDQIVNEGGDHVTYIFANKESSINNIIGFDQETDKIWFNNVTKESLISGAVMSEDGTKITITGATGTSIAGAVLEAPEGEKFSLATPITVLYGSAGTSVKEVAPVRVVNSDTYVYNNNDFKAYDASGKVSLMSAKLTLNNFADNVSIYASGAVADATEEGVGNHLTNHADKVTLRGSGKADELIAEGGTGSSIIGGAGNDTMKVNSGVTGNAFFGGAGNDSIQNNGAGNVFYYSGAKNKEGDDTITSWDLGKDTIQVAGTATTIQGAFVDDGYKVTMKNGTSYITTLTIETGLSKDTENAQKIMVKRGTVEGYITVNKTGTATWAAGAWPTDEAGARTAEEPVIAENDLFDDDNYMNNDAQLSSITNVTENNYSAGNIETLDFENLAKNNYIPVTSYSQQKK